MHDSPSNECAPTAPSTPPDMDAAKQQLKPGDRVEALGNFRKPMGKFGTVETVEEYSVVVLWDGNGRMSLGSAWIRKAIP